MTAEGSGYCISHAFKAGAFRIHLVLHVSGIKMRVPMDRYFNVALHGFEGMRRSGPAWRYSIRFSQLAHQASDFLVIRSVLYQQTFVKREERGALSNKPRSLPVSMSICSEIVAIEGGHRVGVAGKVIMEEEKVKNIQYISSVNIRISHEVIGCADSLLPYITKNKQVCHTLIISPPCCGKTTLIRDLIRQISDGNQYVKGCSVGVVDERSELGGCYLGIAQNHLGSRTDILDCCPKAEGMIMLIRSMSPQVIAVDEIGTREDIHAVEYAMQCGCKLIASVHGLDMEEAKNKPVLGELIRRRMFERYVVLGNGEHPGVIRGIYDERGSVLCRE